MTLVHVRRLAFLLLAGAFLLGAGCLHDKPIPRQEAVDAVLGQVDLEVPPRDLNAKLEPPPHRFSDVDQAWHVRSKTAGFGGWVDAETGEVLDVILDVTVDELE